MQASQGGWMVGSLGDRLMLLSSIGRGVVLLVQSFAGIDVYY